MLCKQFIGFAVAANCFASRKRYEILIDSLLLGWTFRMDLIGAGNHLFKLLCRLPRQSTPRRNVCRESELTVASFQASQLITFHHKQFSAKWVMFFAVFINVVCTLLTPAAAYLGVWPVVFMRVLEGVGGGVTFPAEHIMLSSWAPINERSIMSSIVYAGTALGTVISMLMAGMLAEFYGWASIFYVMGGLSCIWMVLWVFLIQDTPSKQPLISQSERDYIVNSLNQGGGHGHGKKVVPWKKIWTSAPFYGILIAHCCNNWGWYMLLIELPIYMKGVLKFEIKENAVYTATPFLTLWFFSMFISNALDACRNRGLITTTTARKIATFIASFVPLCCMFALCYIGCNRMAAVVIAGIAVTSVGAMFSGFLSNHIDIAPNHAGMLMAATNTLAVRNHCRCCFIPYNFSLLLLPDNPRNHCSQLCGLLDS